MAAAPDPPSGGTTARAVTPDPFLAAPPRAPPAGEPSSEAKRRYQLNLQSNATQQAGVLNAAGDDASTKAPSEGSDAEASSEDSAHGEAIQKADHGEEPSACCLPT